ncbi:MAG TPA: Zn-dependent hydrolase [Caldilineae bacterium]|nr:Zn-dependent hydrolase [Caldilineae bacterium]
MCVQQDRLIHRLNALGEIGATPEGGVTRLAYTPAYRQAEELVRTWMEEAGLNTRIDAVGNLIGRREGRQPGTPCIMLGSHIDTVTNGGRYDGALGVISAIEVAQALQEDGVSLDVPLEVVAFMDEEGTRWKSGLFGSRAMAGLLSEEDLQRRDGNGVVRMEAMRAWGLDVAQWRRAARDPEEVGYYLELHIEQGSVLEREGLAVGVVTDIVGLLLLAIHLRGRADHAGATPMGPLRHDALLGAAEVALAAEATAQATSPTCVATVGRLEIHPGVFNVIPGEAFLTLDLRDIDEGARDRAEARIHQAIHGICQKRGLTAEVEELQRAQPTPMSPLMIEAISSVCARMGLPVYRLPSGAGHDAQIMAKLAETGMIFVRCRDGISHSPAEYVDPEDACLGARVLYETVLSLGVEKLA